MAGEAVISEMNPGNGRPDDRFVTKKLVQRIQILKNKNLKLKKRLEMQQICKTCIELRIERDFLDRKCKKYEVQMEEKCEQGNLLKQVQEENTWLKKFLEGQITQNVLLLTRLQPSTLTETAHEANVPNLLPFYGPFRWEAVEETVHSVIDLTDEHENLRNTADVDQVKKETEEEDSLYESCRIAVEREEGLLWEQDVPVDSTNRIEWANGGMQDEEDEEESSAENLTLGEGTSVGAPEASKNPELANMEAKEEASETDDATQPLACMWVARDSERKCGKELRTSRELASHFAEKHLEAAKRRGFVCLWKGCNRDKVPFFNTQCLTRHFQTHFGQGPFQCTHESCTLTFPTWRAVRNHMGTHPKTKYPCDHSDCDQKFHSRYIMMVHFRSRHMGVGNRGTVHRRVQHSCC